MRWVEYEWGGGLETWETCWLSLSHPLLRYRRPWEKVMNTKLKINWRPKRGKGKGCRCCSSICSRHSDITASHVKKRGTERIVWRTGNQLVLVFTHQKSDSTNCSPLHLPALRHVKHCFWHQLLRANVELFFQICMRQRCHIIWPINHSVDLHTWHWSTLLG